MHTRLLILYCAPTLIGTRLIGRDAMDNMKLLQELISLHKNANNICRKNILRELCECGKIISKDG